MQNILGEWKFRSLLFLSLEGDKPEKTLLSKEAIINSEDPDIQEMSYIAAGTLLFLENGNAEMLMDLPEGTDLTQLSDDERAMLRDGNRYAFQSNAWKEEGGKFFMDSGEYREVAGEEFSSWDEIVFNPDGSITINNMMQMTFER